MRERQRNLPLLDLNRAVLQSAGFRRALRSTEPRHHEKSPALALRRSDRQTSRLRTTMPGCVPGSSAIDEPHSGQKCRRIADLGPYGWPMESKIWACRVDALTSPTPQPPASTCRLLEASNPFVTTSGTSCRHVVGRLPTKTAHSRRHWAPGDLGARQRA
jgi:hypothetical protein